jgi:hypothetical protein
LQNPFGHAAHHPALQAAALLAEARIVVKAHVDAFAG